MYSRPPEILKPKIVNVAGNQIFEISKTFLIFADMVKHSPVEDSNLFWFHRRVYYLWWSTVGVEDTSADNRVRFQLWLLLVASSNLALRTNS